MVVGLGLGPYNGGTVHILALEASTALAAQVDWPTLQCSSHVIQVGQDWLHLKGGCSIYD